MERLKYEELRGDMKEEAKPNYLLMIESSDRNQ